MKRRLQIALFRALACQHQTWEACLAPLYIRGGGILHMCYCSHDAHLASEELRSTLKGPAWAALIGYLVKHGQMRIESVSLDTKVPATVLNKCIPSLSQAQYLATVVSCMNPATVKHNIQFLLKTPSSFPGGSPLTRRSSVRRQNPRYNRTTSRLPAGAGLC